MTHFKTTILAALLTCSSAFAADQTLLTTQSPVNKNSSDGARVNYELGMKFSASASGKIKAIRFYKSSREAGKHTGRIFSASGKQLASVVFANESASGWQQMSLSSPLSISANTVYVVSVNTGRTYYVDTVGGFDRQIVNAALKSVVGNNGVYGPVGKMPANSYRNSNYFRDVVFEASATPPPPPPTEPPPTEPPPPVTPPPTNPPPAGSLSHGKDLTLAMVGPAAIGVTQFTQGQGGAIYNASSAPYIKTVNASATYDGFTVSGPHLLIQNMALSDGLDIYATMPVVIRGCKISGGGYWNVNTRDGANAVYVLYSDLSGGNEGISGSGDNSVFYRNHLTNNSDGFSIGGRNVRVLENFVEKFKVEAGSHNDGLQAAGGNDGLLIARNKIILNADQTGAINLGPWGGSIASGVTVDSNYLAGGGWTFYGGGSGQRNVVVRNNIFGFDVFAKVGYYGVGPAYWVNGTGDIWENNRLADGTLVNP